jgi:hypothetical protein
MSSSACSVDRDDLWSVIILPAQLNTRSLGTLYIILIFRYSFGIIGKFDIFGIPFFKKRQYTGISTLNRYTDITVTPTITRVVPLAYSYNHMIIIW